MFPQTSNLKTWKDFIKAIFHMLLQFRPKVTPRVMKKMKAKVNMSILYMESDANKVVRTFVSWSWGLKISCGKPQKVCCCSVDLAVFSPQYYSWTLSCSREGNRHIFWRKGTMKLLVNVENILPWLGDLCWTSKWRLSPACGSVTVWLFFFALQYLAHW